MMKTIGKCGFLLAVAAVTIGVGGCRDRRFLERCAEDRIRKDFQGEYDRHGYKGLEFSDIKVELIGHECENVSGKVTVRVPSTKFYKILHANWRVQHNYFRDKCTDPAFKYDGKELQKRYNALADAMTEAASWSYGTEIEEIHEKGYFTGTFTVMRGKTTNGDVAPMGYGKFRWEGKDPFRSYDFGTMETVKSLHALEEGSTEARTRADEFFRIGERMDNAVGAFKKALDAFDTENDKMARNRHIDEDKIRQVDRDVDSFKYRANDELSKMKYQLNRKERENESAQKQLSQIREELAFREKNLAGAPEKAAGLKAKIEELEPKYEAMKNEHNALGATSRAEVAEFKKQCEAEKRELGKSIPRYELTKNGPITMKMPNPVYTEECAKIDRKFETFRAEVQKRVTESHEAGTKVKNELEKCKSDYARLSRELPPAEKALAKCRERAEGIEKDAAAKEKLFQEAKAQYDARLKSLQEEYTKRVAEAPAMKEVLRRRMIDDQTAKVANCRESLETTYAELLAALDEGEAFVKRYGGK